MITRDKPADLAPSGRPWGYGIRTWSPDGSSYNGFSGWKLDVGARTEAPDWRPTADCGNGLHCNADGLGDWSLLSSDAGAILGIVRYDPALAVDLEGKIKAPWMETVMTTRTASRASIMGFIAGQARQRIAEAVAGASTASAAGYGGHASAAGSRGHASAAGYGGHASAAGYGGHASAAGYGGHASAAGDGGHASAAGDGGHASAAGDGGHASAAGDHAIAAALGIQGAAQAAETGAIMLAAYGQWNGKAYPLLAVFAGMVGQTYGSTTVKPNTLYGLKADGSLFEVAAP
jgi:hypothetical protein